MSDLLGDARQLPPNVSEETLKVDLALTECKGNRKLAAQVLQIDTRSLNRKIQDSPVLRRRWTNSVRNPPPEPAMPVVPTPMESIEGTAARQVLKPEEKLAADKASYIEHLRAVGLTEEQAKGAGHLMVLQNRHSVDGMSFIGGGVQVATLELLAMIERLSKNPYPDEITPEGVARSGQRLTDEMILRAQAELSRRGKDYSEIMVNRAKVQKILESQENNGKPRGKPGFGPPTLVQAQPGSTVNLHNGPPKE